MFAAKGYEKSADVDMIKVLVAKPVGKLISFIKFLGQEKDLMGGAVEVKLDYKLSNGITANLIECHEVGLNCIAFKLEFFVRHY